MIIYQDMIYDGYLINNDIWLTIKANEQVLYYRIVLTNLSNSKVSSVFTCYADSSSKTTVNLQSIIKSLMNEPDGEVNNSTRVKISITSNTGTNIEFIKSFIRGGNRVNEINQKMFPNQLLRLSEKLPVWSGFQAYDYYLNSDYSITKKSLSELDQSFIDYRRTKGCNNIYLKFLNQKGGYSYWLFESFSEKEQNQNLGYITNRTQNVFGTTVNKLTDLGNESKSSLEIYSKIPKEYKDYARDLIVSPDIYAYQNGDWKKVFSNNNSIEWDNIKKVYSVNLNISLNYSFNPSLLWSN
mgnify:CR=1 FL=1